MKNLGSSSQGMKKKTHLKLEKIGTYVHKKSSGMNVGKESLNSKSTTDQTNENQDDLQENSECFEDPLQRRIFNIQNETG